MITIGGELPIYRSCLVCNGHDDVREITFLQNRDISPQGTAITLCKHCRKNLAKQINEEDRSK